MKLCGCGCGTAIKFEKDYSAGHSSKVNHPMKGKKHTEESKKRMSDSAKGRIPWNLNKGRFKVATMLCGCGCGEKITRKVANLDSPKYVVGHSSRLPEARQRLSVISKKSWENSLFREKNRQNILNSRQQISDSVKKLWESAEYREKQRQVKEVNGTYHIISAKLKENWKDTDFIKNHSGEKSSNWQGGLSYGEYGIEFDDSLKKKIRERDSNLCQNCGEVSKDRKNLHVHHIDYDKKNNSELNLLSLCITCHLSTNAKKTRYLWKAYFSLLMFNRFLAVGSTVFGNLAANLSFLKDIKRLSELGIDDKEITKLSEKHVHEPDVELANRVDEFVKVCWKEIETSFIPKAKKY